MKPKKLDLLVICFCINYPEKLKVLTVHERKIFGQRYGLDACPVEIMSLDKIANINMITRDKVRQTISNVLSKIGFYDWYEKVKDKKEITLSYYDNEKGKLSLHVVELAKGGDKNDR